jgi:hypothetical protein
VVQRGQGDCWRYGTIWCGVVWCGIVRCVVPFAIKLNTRIDGGCVPVFVIGITVDLLSVR